MSSSWLHDALRLKRAEKPFPWQITLLESFMAGTIPPALDIPTGLGKTAVMAIWLVARAQCASLPRRLVYVVDRRAVVDQATTVAEELRAWVADNDDVRQALGLERPLPISTLRGQHVDNREWLEDPSAPAIVVGTVDMIGSRLLFGGYGVSRKMRPFHAGLMGVDTLVALDEAHLVSPFEHLLDTIAKDAGDLSPRDPELRLLVPRFHLLPLSATGRDVDGALGLTNADLEPGQEVRKRLDAEKHLSIKTLEEGADVALALAAEAWRLSGNGTQPMRCIVFCDKREDARKALDLIEKKKKGDKKAGISPVDVCTDLFVGGRRVFEREAAARQLSKLGFLAGTGTPPPLPTFLFATSAAEVGVDLDADHMVCDLVAWERMVQRLGRVNRRGNGNAQVIVVAERPRAPNKTEQKALDANTADRTKKQLEAISAYERDVAEARARRRALDLLPDVDGLRDASPGAIRVLKRRGRTDADLAATLRAASTPEPLRPALTRALIDAWAMTSLEEHTGRPEIEPWLRGWVEKKPQTSIVWRHYLPVHADGTAVRDKEIEAFFEAAPPALIETLETETYRAVSWLVARADAITKRREPNPEDRDRGAPKPLRPTDIAAIALTPAGDFDRTLSLAELVGEGALEKLLEHARPAERADIRALRRNEDGPAREKTNDRLFRSTAGTTLIVDRRLGGLAASGLLDEAADGLPDTVDAGTGPLWPTGADTLPVHFRVQKVKGEPPQPDPDWRQQLRLVIDEPDEGDATCLVVHKWRHAASTEEGRSAGRPQSLGEHEEWAEDDARQLAEKLELPPPYAEMLCAATRLHDEGKRSPRWQRAFNAMADGRIYAKTLGPVNVALLDGYRHELGSLPHAEDNDRIRLLPEDLRDLALHLIAAHHGFARPVIRTSGCEDAPPSALMDRARDVALRFVRLQERWGPWGLAWWESLLRAADQQASRRNDEVKGE